MADPTARTEHRSWSGLSARLGPACAAFAAVLGMQLAMQRGYPLADAEPARRELWSVSELIVALVVWLVGLVVWLAWSSGRRRGAASTWAFSLAGAFVVAAVAANLAGEGRAEFATNYDGGLVWFLTSLVGFTVGSGVIIGIPVFHGVGAGAHRIGLTVASTIAGALLAPTAFNEDVLERVNLLSVVVVAGLPAVAGLLVGVPRRPSRLALLGAAAVTAVHLVLLSPLAALATRAGHEDAFFSQSWLTFLGMAAVWSTVGFAVERRQSGTAAEPVGTGASPDAKGTS